MKYRLSIQVTTIRQYTYITAANWDFDEPITLSVITQAEMELVNKMCVPRVTILSWSQIAETVE